MGGGGISCFAPVRAASGSLSGVFNTRIRVCRVSCGNGVPLFPQLAAKTVRFPVFHSRFGIRGLPHGSAKPYVPPGVQSGEAGPATVSSVSRCEKS